MSILLNNLWIWFVIAFLIAAIGGYKFMNDRLLKTLGITTVSALLVLLIGFTIFYGFETDYKSISRTMDGISVALEANDIPKVLEFIADDAEKTRNFAKRQLGMVDISSAKYYNLEVEPNYSTHPPTAEINLTAVINGKLKGGSFFGEMPFGPQRVEVRAILEKDGKEWLITDQYSISRSADDPQGFSTFGND